MDDEILQLELLRQAIICEQFVLHYQPCINIYTGEMVSIEALIRWQHPTAGLIYPDAFIPLAERSGLIVEIGEWVLIQACKRMKQWQNEGVEDPQTLIMLQSMVCPHGQGFHISYPMDSTSTENYFFSLQKSIPSPLIKF